MRIDDRLGDRKSEPEPAGFGIARGVGAIEPVEQPVVVSLFEIRRGVGHGKQDLSAGFFQRQRDAAALRRILHGVVQQDRNELADRFFVAVQGKHRLNVRGKRLVLRQSNRLERLRRIRNDIGQREVQQLRFCAFLLHPREVNEIVGQRRKPVRLRADIRDPFVVPDILLEHVRVRADDRDRRLELVPRVGDKLLLLFIALCDRTHDPRRQKHQQQKDHDKARRGDADARPKERAERRKLAPTVQKDPARSGVLVYAQIPVLARESLFVSFLCGSFRHFQRRLLVYGHNVFEIGAFDFAGFRKCHRKVARLIRKLAVPFTPPIVPRAVGRFRHIPSAEGECAGRIPVHFRKHGKRIV